MQARSLLGAAIAALLFSGAAHAGGAYKTVTFQNYSTGSSAVKITSPWSGMVNAGQFNLSVDGAATQSFCIELAQSMAFGTPYSNYYWTTLNGSNGGVTQIQLDRFSRLYENHYADVSTGAVASAAFQMAVWEIIMDGQKTLNLSNGSFAATTGSSAANLAQNWLTNLDSLAMGSWQFDRLSSATNQDQLVARHANNCSTTGSGSSGGAGGAGGVGGGVGGSGTGQCGGGGNGGNVPLPGTVALLGLGLLGTRFFGRKAR